MLIASYTNNLIEAGCDEVGVGSLAGPIVACAVVLPKNYINPNINDSKSLTFHQRKVLSKEIKSRALSWSLGICDNIEVDKMNPKNASILAMHKALDKLKIKPEVLLIDGNIFKAYNFIPYICIIKGDTKYLSIAAASIVAKDFRDNLMQELSMQISYNYMWKNNKGYPTKEHIRSIKKYGITQYHRKTFGICKFFK